MATINTLEHQIQILENIKQALHAGYYSIDALLNEIDKILYSVQHEEFKYSVKYRRTKDNVHSHMGCYRNYATRHKYKALGYLQDIKGAIIQQCVKRAVVIIEKLIDTNFFQKPVISKLDSWQPLQNVNLAFETLRI
ncbi:hypothetical protein [Virgibacillus salexigens]|uniref:hypothetical protein n=1 Tax=Virgibacillus salexigens TaxID=61016 RepID=UPI00190C5E10|nr:hypothetical protein [Virgibacillus salexigens]